MFSLLRRWFSGPPAEPSPSYPRYGVSDEDARAIEAALRQQEEFHHQVMSMGSEEPGVVAIRTGVQVAPLAGGGEFLRAVRDGDGWRFECVGGWTS